MQLRKMRLDLVIIFYSALKIVFIFLSEKMCEDLRLMTEMTL